MTPDRLTSPRVGLSPTRPIAPDGQTIEPSVSVPIATWASAAATAAPEPLDDPHGLRSRTYGLLVCPPTPLHPDVERPPRKFAHSERFALPRITAPADRSRRTSLASCAGREPSSAREPAVSPRSAVSMLSFRSTGTPSSLLRGPCVAPVRVARRPPRPAPAGLQLQDRVHVVVERGDPAQVGGGEPVRCEITPRSIRAWIYRDGQRVEPRLGPDRGRGSGRLAATVGRTAVPPASVTIATSATRTDDMRRIVASSVGGARSAP